MNRRAFIAAGACCCTALYGSIALGQAPETSSEGLPGWQMPARFSRPDAASDEGGLWALMDREERRLRRSPFALRDPAFREYVQGIACRLAAEHCADVRVHLIKTPLFNASMAPNGMMQVWTGLMLRVDNEAQLAAVLGHEIGHYLARHSIERLRDVKSRSGFAQVFGLFGVVGAIGQLGLVAGMHAYSRDHERAADAIGAKLMHAAGYDIREAAKVWQNLRSETSAQGGDPATRNPLFASHPLADEREETLAKLAVQFPGGGNGEERWRKNVRPFLSQWLAEEVRRGQHEESLVLVTRMIKRSPSDAAFLFARAEVYRARAQDGDLDSAHADYRAAANLGGEPPETHRGLGFIYRQRNQPEDARNSFQRYLDLAPQAPDYLMIKSYLEELHS